MSATFPTVNIPKSVSAKIETVLRDKFGDAFVEMNILDIETHGDRITFVIEIELIQRRDGQQESLFGLTRQVRDAMGKCGNAFFPVLRPVAHYA